MNISEAGCAKLVCTRCHGILLKQCAPHEVEQTMVTLRIMANMKDGVCGECREGNHQPAHRVSER